MSLAVRSSQCADVSSPVPHVKGPLFLTLWVWLPREPSRPDCSWSGTNSLSLTVFFLPSSSPPSPLVLSRKQERVGRPWNASSHPAQSTKPEVTEAWPPTTGLIVEILRLTHTHTHTVNDVKTLFTFSSCKEFMFIWWHVSTLIHKDCKKMYDLNAQK